MTPETNGRSETWLYQLFSDNENLYKLARAYCDQPIVLYTGAGVSTGQTVEIRKGLRQTFGLPTWIPLLKEIVSSAGGDTRAVSSPDPWKAAQKAVDACGGIKFFRQHLSKVICSPHNYQKTMGQLSGHFVRCAKTLTSVAAFCGCINGQIAASAAGETTPSRVFFTNTPNRRVRAVVTVNYDCFLESASSNLFRKAVLKPVTAKGSLAGSLGRTPVFHSHGYVPHPFYQHNTDRIKMVSKLVITRDDYERAWNEHNVFGTTMAPQIHYLLHYTTLFIGFSFGDKYVCRLLRRLNRDFLSHHHGDRSHYALLSRKRVDQLSPEFFRKIGVRPVAFDKYDEIPGLLARLYMAGLQKDAKGGRFVELPEITPKKHMATGNRIRYSLEDYWNRLWACRNGGVSLPRSRKTTA
jgi:hypothetical protein